MFAFAIENSQIYVHYKGIYTKFLSSDSHFISLEERNVDAFKHDKL